MLDPFRATVWRKEWTHPYLNGAVDYSFTDKRDVWDIHLRQKFPFHRIPDKYVEVFPDARNILDEYYEEDPGKAAPGRLVCGGIRAEF